MGRSAAATVVDALEGRPSEPLSAFPVEVILRAST
jgi:DNA-binding LacI/PurR family transcriptional regulator